MSPLDSFWYGVLSVLSPIITPDWGKLVVLIPWLLVLLVVLFLARIVAAWVSLYQAQPVRGPKIRQRSVKPLLAAHVAVVVVGVLVAIAAFVVGASDPNWTARNSPVGVEVNVPLLILGLAIVVGSAGNGARLWGHEEGSVDAIDRFMALVRRHPGRARRAVAFALGVVLAAAGLALGTVPGPTPTGHPDQPVPVAVVPLLLLGLALAVGAVGASIAAMWKSDPDFDRPESSDATGLVPTEH